MLTVVLVTAGFGLAACGSPETPAPEEPQHSAATTSSAHPSTPGVSGASSATSATTTAGISKDEAGTVATDKYGGQVINVEPDHEKGRATWEVEVKNSREGRIEVDVAQDNGDVVTMEHDNG